MPDRRGEERSQTRQTDAATSRRAPRRARKPRARARVEPTAGADLGGSSKYSNETFEDRSGEGFRANGGRARVSRS